jgi:hypothetical protein
MDSVRILTLEEGVAAVQSTANLAMSFDFALSVYTITILHDFIANTSILSAFGRLAAAATVDAEIGRRTVTAWEPLRSAVPAQGFRPSRDRPAA